MDETFTTESWGITCDHDLQLRQGLVCGVSQEDVDVSQHALLLLDDAVGPPLLIQDDEGAFWEQEVGKSQQWNEPEKENNAWQGLQSLHSGGVRALCDITGGARPGTRTLVKPVGEIKGDFFFPTDGTETEMTAI